MSVKFTPVVTTLKNTLVVELEYEHGDADATTFEYVNIPVLPEQKESIGVLLSMIEHGLECQNAERDDYTIDPFFVDETIDYDDNQGIPLVGVEVRFSFDYNSPKEKGTVVSVDHEQKYIIIRSSTGEEHQFDFDEIEDCIASSTGMMVMDGGEISFTYNGINVNIGNVGDCTVDCQFNASGGINAVYYYDENAIKYSVTEY
ncbi:hypothetical protein FDH34_gp482 [Serratia phage BF]|uniref:Uncharacterized protein n=1 Tax=Serratia phage BF TaxID=1962671 RepID=A0A1S6UB57_9CAUD|nr:hypothetical protein FDH34_gp482 [Serratia phage BF]AQW88963.1 hypothetical protein BF_0438 [Serratia phage BF]